jgi:hypothetical protein
MGAVSLDLLNRWQKVNWGSGDFVQFWALLSTRGGTTTMTMTIGAIGMSFEFPRDEQIWFGDIDAHKVSKAPPVNGDKIDPMLKAHMYVWSYPPIERAFDTQSSTNQVFIHQFDNKHSIFINVNKIKADFHLVGDLDIFFDCDAVAEENKVQQGGTYYTTTGYAKVNPDDPIFYYWLGPDYYYTGYDLGQAQLWFNRITSGNYYLENPRRLLGPPATLQRYDRPPWDDIEYGFANIALGGSAIKGATNFSVDLEWPFAQYRMYGVEETDTMDESGSAPVTNDFDRLDNAFTVDVKYNIKTGKFTVTSSLDDDEPPVLG